MIMSAYKQENREGKIVVVNTGTGQVMGRFVAKHFADDFMSRLPEPEAPKRARGPKGKMKADDPATPENEAWEGGKAPKKKAVKKKAPAKKKAKKK